MDGLGEAIAQPQRVVQLDRGSDPFAPRLDAARGEGAAHGARVEAQRGAHEGERLGDVGEMQGRYRGDVGEM